MWRGCNRAMCVEHMDFSIKPRDKHGPPQMINYACKTPVCNSNYNKTRCCKCIFWLMIPIIFTILAIVLPIVLTRKCKQFDYEVDDNGQVVKECVRMGYDDDGKGGGHGGY